MRPSRFTSVGVTNPLSLSLCYHKAPDAHHLEHLKPFIHAGFHGLVVYLMVGWIFRTGYRLKP